MSLTCSVLLCFSEWYTNGDYLVLLVTVAIILPLSLLRNLGKQRVCVIVRVKDWLSSGDALACVQEFEKEIKICSQLGAR